MGGREHDEARTIRAQKEDARHAEVVADYVAQLEALDQERFEAQTECDRLLAQNEAKDKALAWYAALLDLALTFIPVDRFDQFMERRAALAASAAQEAAR